MSRRVGLRFMQSVGGAILCPPAGVEQFTNDHFQTGDFTGWTMGTGDFFIDDGTCVQAHWGTSIAPFIGSYDAAQGDDNDVWLENLLSTPVPAKCLVATSVFSITTADLGAVCAPATQKARILYTDDTYTEVDLNPAGDYGWVTYDLKPYVEAGKTIKGVRYIGTTAYLYPSCTLHVGQVTLKV